MSTVRVLVVIMLTVLLVASVSAKPAADISALAAIKGDALPEERDPRPGAPPGGESQSKQVLPLADELAGDQAQTQTRVSVGSVEASLMNSPGFIVDKSWEDWQYTVKGRRVDFRGNNDIHFSYNNTWSGNDVRRMGYNVYDPTAGPGGGWPNIAEVGCEVQASGEPGAYPALDVQPSGMVVLCGYDEASGEPDNHTFYQSGQHSCFWGYGTQIPPEVYEPWMIDPTSTLLWPLVEIQEYAGDTITHVIGFESNVSSGWGGLPFRSLVYARKLGSSQAGTWTDATVIDTIGYQGGHITASRVSNKVAVIYTKIKWEGVEYSQPFDNDVYYRENDNGGVYVHWSAPINITNYPRWEPSYTAWHEVHGLYDTDDNLHIIWNASPTLEWPYNNIHQNWGTFDASLFHWRYQDPDPTDSATSRIHNAEWGVGMETLCSFGGYNAMNLAFFSIAECAGRLYVVWSMWNDYFADPPLVEDCASGAWSSIHRANGELYMSVSFTLEGAAWDSYRNVTHTIRPECDSISAGGVCENDTKSVLSRYGLDRQTGVLAWNDADDPQYWFWDPLNWQSPDSVEGEWSNDSILHLFYLDDHFPSTGWYGQGPLTENELRWIQLACVEPVVAPFISVDPRSVEYPYWTPNGVADTLEIEVRNDGNAELDVVEIDYAVTPGYPDWLGVSVTQLMNIPYNECTHFDIYVNKNGIIDNPGGSVLLQGDVWLKPAETDPPANTDSLSIPIRVVVADTLADVHWDTVATTYWMDSYKSSSGSNEFVAAMVDNIGSIGANSFGGVNLDFAVMGGDCDTTADVYLCSGGLLLLQNTWDTVYLSTSLHAMGFAEERYFKPLPNTGWQGGANADYDSVFTGEFANWDTSIVMTRTYYAPRNHNENPTFVVVKTTLDGTDDYTPITNLTIGVADDWDIPADNGIDNMAGVSVAHNMVYCQGVDTVETEYPTDCQENVNRFGANAFMGYYTATEYTANSCANNATMYGSWADSFHGWWDDAVDTNYAAVWDSMEAHPGLSGNTGEWDQAVFTTWLQDYTLPAGEELTFYSMYVTEQNGDFYDFEASITDAKDWFYEYIRPGCGGCCIGVRGDVDLEGTCSPWEQVCDITDLTCMIDHLFINMTPLCCSEEAELDMVPGITVNDLLFIIDHFWLTHSPLPSCSDEPNGSYQASADTIEFRNVIVPADSSTWDVELWFKSIAPYGAVTVPFAFSCPRSLISLDSMTLLTCGVQCFGNIHWSDPRAMYATLTFDGNTLPSGEHQLATLHFSLQSSSQPQQITIAASTYPPENILLVSRFDAGGGADGYIPVLETGGVPVDEPLGNGVIDTVGDTMSVCGIGDSGDDGVRLVGDPGSIGISMNMNDVDLSTENAEISFQLVGQVAGAKGVQIQVMSGVGVYQDPGGSIQFISDYSFLGATGTEVRVFNDSAPVGVATVNEVGLVVTGHDAGAGLPQLISTSMQVIHPPAFIAVFDRLVEFRLIGGPVLFGNEIHLVAFDAVDTVISFESVDVTGKHLVCFGLYDIDRSNCCRGLTGNVCCDYDDLVDIADLTRMIDYLFISMEPLCCPAEAEVDGVGDPIMVDVGDLTALIDFLFISFTPPQPCP